MSYIPAESGPEAESVVQAYYIEANPMESRRHPMAELGLTAVVTLLLFCGMAVALVGMTVDIGTVLITTAWILPIVTAIALLWIIIAALASWPLRKAPQWTSLIAGLCASLTLSAIVFGPVWFQVTVDDGWSGGPARLSAIVGIALPLVVLAIQIVVHLVLRARRRSEVPVELG